MFEILNKEKITLIRCRLELINCQSILLSDLFAYCDYINNEIKKINKLIESYSKTLS